jgi:signal transduction histidine kinase
MDAMPTRTDDSEPFLGPRERVWLGGLLAGTLLTLVLKGQLRILSIEALGLLAALVATLATASRAGREPQFKVPWRLLALGLGFQTLSHLLRFRWEALGLPFPPWPSPADWLQVAVLPCLILALVAWPAGSRDRGWRRRCLLDAFVFMGALLFVFWQLGLREFTRLTGPDPLAAAAYFSSFFLATLGFAYWVYLVLPARALPSRALIWLGLLLLGGCVLNLTGLVVGLAGSYAPGHWSDAILPLALGVVAPAAWSKGPIQAAPAPPEAGQPPYLAALPYLPLVAALGLIGWQIAFHRPLLDWQAVAIGAPVMALVLLRQYLALKDVHTLTAGLERKVHERTQALESAQKLMMQTERMNSLAVLGAGLAHDLKNLLGIVTDYALLMQQDVKEGRPASLEDLEAIQSASAQANALANQLMAYGREEEGDATPSDFDLGARVRALTSLLRATLPFSISLEVIAPPEPLRIHGEPRYFDQLLANLVLNAKDAIEGRGRITVAVSRAALKDGHPAAQVEVADTGCGMSDATMARLFEPFFTTKAPGRGTGLGLASIRAIVDQAGGEIEAQSRLGEGSTFRIRLPLA